MKTYVTFVADRFNQKERLPTFINDDNFGEDLAQWIIAKLSQAVDVLADPDPLQEDWGLACPCICGPSLWAYRPGCLSS
jgi:hypothetical protein